MSAWMPWTHRKYPLRLKNMSNIDCGPAQDRPLRCVSNFRTWIPYNGFVLSSYPSLMGYKEYLRISISTKYYFLRYSPIFFISAPCAVGGSPLFKFRKLINTFQPSFRIILCPRGNFMPRQFSSLTGFYPDRGGVEVTGQTASLLAKAAPSLQHHSSIGSWSLPMTIFFKLSPPLTNYNVWTLISHGY